MPKYFISNNRIMLKYLLLAISLAISIPPSKGYCAGYPRRDAVVEAVQVVSPAVVNISSEYEIRKNVNPFSGFGMSPELDTLFRDFFDYRFKKKFKRTSLGSGVIIDGQRGFVLTNAHVIEETGTITVTLKDEREFNAQVVGADPESDLAVLRILSDSTLPAIKMGNSNDLMIGETVIAIGNPFGFSNTVTTGVISAVKRSIKTDNRVFHDFIQTDASINPGNSGGPLLNINGELIGINTAIYANAQGIGFAIPINKARRIISDLIQYGEVIPAWTGIIVQNLTARLANYLNIKETNGVVVMEIEDQSPASQSGIKEGDIILSLNKNKIESIEDYYTRIKGVAAGENIDVLIFRKESKIKKTIKTAGYPMENALDLAYSLLGIAVENLSNSSMLLNKSSLKGVVIIKIKQHAYLARIGAEPGDIIRQINEYKIDNTEDFKKAIVKYRRKKSMVILLQRGGRGYYLTIEI